MKRKSRYKPVYKEGVQGVKYWEEDPLLDLKEGQAASDAQAQGMSQMAGNTISAINPAIGAIYKAGSAIGAGIRKGREDEKGAQVTSDLFNPSHGAFTALETGDIEDAIPIIGGFKRAKEAKAAKQEAERKAKKFAGIKEAFDTTVSDPTEVQSKLSRFKKGSKYVYPDGTKHKENPKKEDEPVIPKDSKSSIANIKKTLMDFYELDDKDFDKINKVVNNIKTLEKTGKHILKNPRVGTFENIGNKAKRLAEDTTEGIGDFLFGAGQEFKDLVSTELFGEDANIGEFNISQRTLDESSLPDDVKNLNPFLHGEQIASAIIADNYKRALEETEGDKEAAMKIAASSFNKSYENSLEDYKEGKSSFFADEATKFKKGSKYIKENSDKTRKNSIFNSNETSKDEMSSQDNIPIEVEKNELVFRKIGRNYKLVKDFKGGKLHENGGIDTKVQEGDVIIPGAKRTDVLAMLNKDGSVNPVYQPDFESMRMQLPTDGDKAQDGMQIASYAAQLTPALVNIFSGSEEAEKTPRRYIRPTKMRFIDTSQEKINEANTTYRGDIKNIVGKAGGNAGVVLANLGTASTRRNKYVSSILSQKAKEKQNIENINTSILNRGEEINRTVDERADVADAQNRAMARNFRREGISQAADATQQYFKNQQLQSRDEKLMRAENLKALGLISSDFDIDPSEITRYLEEGGELPSLNYRNREPLDINDISKPEGFDTLKLNQGINTIPTPLDDMPDMLDINDTLNFGTFS